MKFIMLLLVLTACAHKVVSDGGQVTYDKTVYETLSPQDVTTYAQTVIRRDQRQPENVTLDEITHHPAGEIRRLAVVVFETQFQTSRSGLASDRNVYLSPRGKQILTEEMYRYLDKELRRLTTDAGVTLLKAKELLNSKAYRTSGFTTTDYVMAKRDRLSSDDVFWKLSGQRIPEVSMLTPRDFQDISLVLIPANEMMGGPKPSQHQSHWFNDIAKELDVDAFVLVALGGEWRRGGVDKRTKEEIPEVMTVKLESTLFYPWKTYHEVGTQKGLRDLAKVNVPLAAYAATVVLPVKITVAESEETFETAMTNVIGPFKETMGRLLTLNAERMATEVLSTHQVKVGEK